MSYAEIRVTDGVEDTSSVGDPSAREAATEIDCASAAAIQ